ncbi:hypothetical protein SK3146_00101 [Paenibacillus konkukensis]|uniref:DUF4181 domain-containing protein n=1 Tax=Paenibacillus konkukensis TaxID=2020716 RepID=A0ABY4RFR7_9BACL|nr:CLC_0170 family protein [Paenibacillus konkukensis]UQZ80945.1 hypothetical protein SK3146_00101 [Paenibacillus konkukensis]
MTIVIGFVESLSSYYLVALFVGIGLFLRLRYYISYKDRKLSKDAAFAKYGGYCCILLSCVVLVAHFIII